MPADTDAENRSRRLVLITGASGGIGEAFAHLLAEEQCDLILVSRKEDELNRVRGQISAKHDKREISVIATDLGRPEAGALLFEELNKRHMFPDILVNNAGYGLYGRTAELPYEEQIGVVDLNVRSLTDLTLRALPAMIAR